jgi:DNA-binding cell septation regulator SpoVG
MRVTEITIRIEREPSNPQIRGYAAIVLDDVFKVDHIRIIQTAQGNLVVIMPNRRAPGPSPGGRNTRYDKKGRPWHFRDMAHLIRPGFQQYLSATILAAYRNTTRLDKDELVYSIPAPSRITAEAV